MQTCGFERDEYSSSKEKDFINLGDINEFLFKGVHRESMITQPRIP